MKHNVIFLFAALVSLAAGCIRDSSSDIPTVKNFDAKKYLGKWYELARLPNNFEQGMSNTYAIYSSRKDGNINVLNCGIRNQQNVCVTAIAGYAKPETGELKVSFFRPFYTPYRIIKLASDYSYAVVTGGNKKYLWILSRTPVPDPDLLQMVLEEAQKRGYDTSELIWVDQSRNIAAMGD